MAKYNINEEPIKEPKFKTFDFHIKPCKKNICKQQASMVFFESERLCNELLNIEFADQNIVLDKPSKDPNKCDFVSTDYRIMGYYIIPTERPLNTNINSFDFQPVWVKLSGTDHLESITEPINFTPTSYYSTTQASTNGIILPQLFSNNFNHNIFQYNDDAMSSGFMKAFISWYELKSIVNHSDYVGISSSIISTDNLDIGEEAFKKGVNKMCSRSYFTYRFTGFKEYTVGDDEYVDGWIQNMPVGKTFLVKSNLIFNRNKQVDVDYRKPGETWATPCPPMWYEM